MHVPWMKLSHSLMYGMNFLILVRSYSQTYIINFYKTAVNFKTFWWMKTYHKEAVNNHYFNLVLWIKFIHWLFIPQVCINTHIWRSLKKGMHWMKIIMYLFCCFLQCCFNRALREFYHLQFYIKWASVLRQFSRFKIISQIMYVNYINYIIILTKHCNMYCLTRWKSFLLCT